MDALQAIFTRRSVRDYTDKDVSDEMVETLLHAAMIAPSAVNNQDWAFVVVRDRKILGQLADGLNRSGEMLRKAPVAIVVCGDWDLAIRHAKDYWIEDCSAATENILIAANALGLGAVWLGTYPQTDKMQRVATTLNLPGHIIPMCVISIGWPASLKESAADERFDPEKIHFNQW